MLKSNRVRVLLLATLFLAALVFGMTTHSPDDALAVSNATYYNNANHSKVVGEFGYDCCNNPVAWGKKTSYVVYGGCFPCVPPPQ